MKSLTIFSYTVAVSLIGLASAAFASASTCTPPGQDAPAPDNCFPIFNNTNQSFTAYGSTATGAQQGTAVTIPAADPNGNASITGVATNNRQVYLSNSACSSLVGKYGYITLPSYSAGLNINLDINGNIQCGVN